MKEEEFRETAKDFSTELLDLMDSYEGEVDQSRLAFVALSLLTGLCMTALGKEKGLDFVNISVRAGVDTYKAMNQ